jgi:hypothetical protein
MNINNINQDNPDNYDPIGWEITGKPNIPFLSRGLAFLLGALVFLWLGYIITPTILH